MENDTPRRMPNVPPFVKFVCANVPMVFDDSLSYYEALCALWKYVQGMTDVINNNATLEEEFIEKFNVLQGKFIELKNYVDTYFDNLDVQEEINNKLDAMVEDGTLAEIIASYLNAKAIFAFDSVSDMLASTNLIEGSYAKTLGYYTKDDGGAALYKIRKVTNDDVIDGAFIIEFPDSADELVAELIIENGKIYVNQLGADSTGTNDASAKINLGLTKINDLWIAGSKINTLVFKGKYLLNNQIEVPPCAKLRSDGFVKFISNVQSESTIFIHYLSDDLPESDIAKQTYINGDLINFESGCLLESTGDFHDSSATGIEIGERTNRGTQYTIARYMIRNMCIKNFNVGILFNSYNVYIGNHENLHLEENMSNIRFGLASQNSTASNIGERMTFNNCVIAAADKGVEYQTKYWTTFFTNCSFDFVNKCFQCYNNGVVGIKVHVDGSHFEGFYSLFEDFVTNTRPNFYISNCEILNSEGTTTLLKNCDNTYPLHLTNCNLQHKYSTSDYDPEHYVNINQNIILNENLYTPIISHNYSMYNNLLNKFVDGIADGSTSIANGDYIGEFKVDEHYSCGHTATVTTDDYLYTGHKSLTLTKTSDAGSAILLNAYTSKRAVNGAKMIYTTVISDGNIQADQRCMIRFYDAGGNRITTTDYNYNFGTLPTAGNWSLNPMGYSCVVPPNAVTYDAYLIIKGSTSDGVGATLKLGGVIVNAR